jgi:cytochrome c oxidase cbb3-type subunit 1
MDYKQDDKRLLKFLVASSIFFFIGTVHGVLQVISPVRAWLDSIGSPYGGPGHMIDPLAHAHINVVGGVVIFLMAVTYYLFPRIARVPLYSQKLVEYTFWFVTIGICGFYSTLLFFGIWEGMLLLEEGAEAVERAHHYYGPTIAIVSTVMGIGFWIYFANIFMTYKTYRAQRD